MKNVSFSFILGVCIGVSVSYVCAVYFFSPQPTDDNLSVITFEGGSLSVEVAATDEARIRGLSGRTSLTSDGMLFIFPEDAYYGIWMKDMHIALDILWLNAEGRVVTLMSGVRPETYPEVFTPSAPARYVLELREGDIVRHAITTDTIFTITQ